MTLAASGVHLVRAPVNVIIADNKYCFKDTHGLWNVCYGQLKMLFYTAKNLSPMLAEQTVDNCKTCFYWLSLGKVATLFRVEQVASYTWELSLLGGTWLLVLGRLQEGNLIFQLGSYVDWSCPIFYSRKIVNWSRQSNFRNVL